MEVADLRRNTDETGRIGRSLQIHFEPLHPGLRQVDRTVHDTAVSRAHLDIYSAEHPQSSQAGIGVVHIPFVIQGSGTDRVHIPERALVELEVEVVGEGHRPDVELPQRTGVIGGLVPGIFVHDHLQIGSISTGEGVRHERVEVLREAEVAVVPEIPGGTLRFFLKGVLRKKFSGLDGDVGGIGAEILPNSPSGTV